ncbi:hypothetical protein DMX02_04205 [Pseudomonas jessenii]|nr:hypothetical protein DMX02_04205 [Pseudomonas jessenii]
MRNSDIAYFCILEGDSVEAAQKELLCAAAVEYTDFLIISNSRELLIEVVHYIESNVQIRPRLLLVPSNSVLATAENFITYHYPAHNPNKLHLKFDVHTGILTESTQLRAEDFSTDQDNITYYLKDTHNLHPIVRHAVETACAERNELSRIVNQLLIGCSFLPDNIIKNKCAGTDFDGLQLQELSAFAEHLILLKPQLQMLKIETESIIQHCKSLLLVCPVTSTDLSDAYPTAALQNGFPCVYKVMSILHHIGYQLAMQRQLLNKAFMHTFRTYECYASGALFLRTATIASHTNKKGTFPDVYKLNGEKVTGFTAIYKGIGAGFHLTNDSDYALCQFYIDLRNKFHYTHGDLKPSKILILQFAQAVVKQILKIEAAENQQTFRWEDVHQQTARILLGDYPTEVVLAISRHLGMPPFQSFVEL